MAKTTKPKQYNFLADDVDSDATKPINVRLPESLYNRFTDVKQRVNNHGKTLSITEIVKIAIESACDEADAFLATNPPIVERKPKKDNKGKGKSENNTGANTEVKSNEQARSALHNYQPKKTA